MKHVTWTIVAAVLLACSAPAWAANIITNGDFSGGTAGSWAPGAAQGAGDAVPTGWTGFDTANGGLHVAGDAIVFNAGNQPPINWIQQAVPTVAGQWYAVEWDHQDGPGSYPQRAVSTINVWNGTDTSGAPDLGDRWSAYPTSNLQQVFLSASGQTTIRFSDEGSNSSSNDTKMDNASADLANGSINVAPSLGAASSLSHHGSFGVDPQGAIDGSGNTTQGVTNFHSAGNANQWWRADFAEPVPVSRLEIQARGGFTGRNGDILEVLDAGGSVIASYAIPDQNLVTIDGGWMASAVVIRNDASATDPLNLAEVRAFSDFQAGKMLAPNLIKNGDFSLGNGGTWLPGATTTSNQTPTHWASYATAANALHVSGEAVIFNAANQPAGSYVQQTVGIDPAKWYVLEWDHQDGPGSHPDRAVSSAQIWDGASATGTPDLGDRRVRYPTADIQHLLQASSGQATIQLGDLGSNSSSNDTKIDNVSLRLADGFYNVAPSLGVATSKSHHGSFGVDPQQAVDGSSNYSNGATNFHSGGTVDEWWHLEFDEIVRLGRVEVQARSGFTGRNGDFIDFINPDGEVIDTLPIADMNLWSADGSWVVKAIEIRSNNGAPLNLAEVRAFAEFADGELVVPEPATMALCAMGLAGLAGYARRRRKAA